MTRSALTPKPDIDSFYEYTPQARALLNSRPSRFSKNAFPLFGKKSHMGGSRLRTADPETLRMVDDRRANATLQLWRRWQLVSVSVTSDHRDLGIAEALSARILHGLIVYPGRRLDFSGSAYPALTRSHPRTWK
jgi:hypothetical protein